MCEASLSGGQPCNFKELLLPLFMKLNALFCLPCSHTSPPNINHLRVRSLHHDCHLPPECLPTPPLPSHTLNHKGNESILTIYHVSPLSTPSSNASMLAHVILQGPEGWSKRYFELTNFFEFSDYVYYFYVFVFFCIFKSTCFRLISSHLEPQDYPRGGSASV